MLHWQNVLKPVFDESTKKSDENLCHAVNFG